MDEVAAERLTDRWWDEVWAAGDLDVLDEVLTDPFTRNISSGTIVSSRDDYKRLLRSLLRTHHRPEVSIDNRSIDGDHVWTRATTRGVNLETGGGSVISWLLVQRIESGRIAEHWVLATRDVDWGR
jgi:hypothetical protein